MNLRRRRAVNAAANSYVPSIALLLLPLCNVLVRLVGKLKVQHRGERRPGHQNRPLNDSVLHYICLTCVQESRPRLLPGDSYVVPFGVVYYNPQKENKSEPRRIYIGYIGVYGVSRYTASPQQPKDLYEAIMRVLQGPPVPGLDETEFWKALLVQRADKEGSSMPASEESHWPNVEA